MSSNARIPKILIISSDTGGGHRSAAAAIVAGVQKFLDSESYAIRVVRAVEESHHLADKLVTTGSSIAFAPRRASSFISAASVTLPDFSNAGARTSLSVFIRSRNIYSVAC
jgi:hypothetical protein